MITVGIAFKRGRGGDDADSEEAFVARSLRCLHPREKEGFRAGRSVAKERDTAQPDFGSDASYMVMSHARLYGWNLKLTIASTTLGALGNCLLAARVPKESELSLWAQTPSASSVCRAPVAARSQDRTHTGALKTGRDSLLQSVRAVPLALHFTAVDVVRYFTRVLDVPPKRTKEGSTIFEDNTSRWPEDRYRILIAQDNGDVVVSFAVGGDYGMNLAREFFECALFQRAESMRLYGLLNEAEQAPIATLPRFSVSMRSWQTKERVHVVMRFFRPDKSIALLDPQDLGVRASAGFSKPSSSASW